MDTADANQPARGAYLPKLVELLHDDPSRLSPETRRRVAVILDDPGLDPRTAEDLISELAEDDQEVAELWDQVQQEPPEAKRGFDLVRPGRLGRGPTHLWICPVKGCQRQEKGNGWRTISGVARCDDHGKELEPTRIAGP
jgi:hypothetical protein